MRKAIFTVDTIKQILKSLSKKRPIFHSEADFQHALAWEIHQKFKEIDIRLEKRFLVCELGAIYVDVVLKVNDAVIAIETKYATKKLEVELNGEKFVLKEHSAQDLRRYDFMVDIYRLEKLKSGGKITKGYVVFLTNDPNYWEKSTRENTNDKAFRIHQGRKIEAGKPLQWAPQTGKGTKMGREKVLKFRKNYSFEWTVYSQVANCEFKYLVVEV